MRANVTENVRFNKCNKYEFSFMAAIHRVGQKKLHP